MNSIFRFLGKQNKISNQETLFSLKSVVVLIFLPNQQQLEPSDNQTGCMLPFPEANSFVVSYPFLNQLFVN